jgi:hypothetical protein
MILQLVRATQAMKQRPLGRRKLVIKTIAQEASVAVTATRRNYLTELHVVQGRSSGIWRRCINRRGNGSSKRKGRTIEDQLQRSEPVQYFKRQVHALEEELHRMQKMSQRATSLPPIRSTTPKLSASKHTKRGSKTSPPSLREARGHSVRSSTRTAFLGSAR